MSVSEPGYGEGQNWRDAATRSLDAMHERAVKAEAEVERLRGLVHEVAVSGVSYDEPRIHYVEVQVDRDTWTALQEGRPWAT